MGSPQDLQRFLEENRLSEYFPLLQREGYEVQDLLETDETTLLELMGGKKAHLGRLKNGLEKIRGGGEQGRTSGPFRNLFSGLPTVLAVPAVEFAAGHDANPVLRLWSLCDLVELSARLAVITGLAEHRGEPPEKLRSTLSEKIERPSLGQWLQMARAVAEHLPQDAAFPALARFVARLDIEICGQGDLNSSVVSLRNRLAHGGGLSKKAAAGIVSAWESRMEKLAEVFLPWCDFQLVSFAADGTARLLRGLNPTAWDGKVRQKDDGMICGIAGGRELNLWPLMVRLLTDEETVSGIYSRRGEVRLEYTPFEGNLPVLEAEVDEGFMTLFRRLPRSSQGPNQFADFTEELRKEASRRVGREKEMDQLIQSVGSLPPGGILWVGGVAGAGKSCLMASVAINLMERQPEQTLVLTYSFKAGSGRCSVEQFLGFASERIEAWEGLDQTAFSSTKQRISLQARFLELVRSVKDGWNLLVVADGLDELPALSDKWLDTVILASSKLRQPGGSVRWVLAGRPERGITAKLLTGGAKEVFPDGLPPMRPDDVRAFFFERLSRSKFRSRLVERDEQRGDILANPFLEEVIRRSEGLPLYMNHVAGDLIAGRITPDQERQLPKGLAAYHEELLRRCAVGDLQAVMTPLVSILALAHEPLGAPLLTSILRSAGRLDSENVTLVERALAGVSSMIRRTPLDDGKDGFALYHTSLREHLRATDSFRETLATMRKKLSAFCSDAMQNSRKNPPCYVRRQAVKHFLEAEDWDNATAALSDIKLIAARAIARELPAMLGDYAQAASLLPEGEKESQTEAARQRDLDRYTREICEYASTWTRIRDGSGEAKPPQPRPVESARLRAQEDIAAEIKRMTETPSRLDIVKAFRTFVATNSAPLQKHSAQAGFAANLARNDAPAGPVHEEGKRRLDPLRCVKLLRDFAYECRDHGKYNPIPACVANFEGHLGSVTSIAVSADGRRIATVGHDKTVRIWDNDAGVCQKVLDGHEDEVASVAMSADGRLAVSASWDTTLRVWNVESGECLKVLSGHTKNITSVAVTPDGRRVISGSWDKSLRVWDLGSGECIGIFGGHEQSVTSVAISADGCSAVSGSRDKTLRVWDIGSGECTNILQAHESEVIAVAASADGRRIVSGGRDRAILLWDTETGDCTEVGDGDPCSSDRHGKCINSVGITADSKRAVSGSDDGTLRLWDIESGECLKVFAWHGGAVTAVAISADGRFIFSADREGNVCKWDPVSGGGSLNMEWEEWENWMFVKTHDDQEIFDEYASYRLFETGTEISGKVVLKPSRESTLQLKMKDTGESIAEFFLHGLSKDGNDWADYRRLVVGMSQGAAGIRQMNHKGDITHHRVGVFRLENL